ncbi:hypothetical protein [Jeotgalibaca sp. A127]|uniref:hypothetical protein n=1 Tax=Jeotgalibaca sp. A127 TaxID=3457324 RepID=UPI003FD58831
MEYAVYKGDKLLVIGTKEECAERLNVKTSTILFYTSDIYQRRGNGSKNRRIAIRLED